MNLGDNQSKFLSFSTKYDLFDCKTSFLARRKIRITNIKLKITIKLKNTGFYSDFLAFWGSALDIIAFFREAGSTTRFPTRLGILLF